MATMQEILSMLGPDESDRTMQAIMTPMEQFTPEDIALLDQFLGAQNEAGLQSYGQRVSEGPINGGVRGNLITDSRMSSGPITEIAQAVPVELLNSMIARPLEEPLPQASYSNEGRTTRSDLSIPFDTRPTLMPEDPLQGWQEVAKGVFKKQDEKGQNQYSNVLTAEGVPTMKTFTPGQQIQGNAALQSLGSSFASRAAAITSTSDPRAKMEQFQQLQVDAAAEKAKILEDLNKQARIAVGIPQLEQEILRQQQLDAQDPKWRSGMGDSSDTEKARTRLNQALARVDNEVNRLASTNVKLRTMDAQLQGMGKLLEYDMKNADRVAAREDRQSATLDNIKINRALQAEEKQRTQAERQRLEAEEQIRTVGPEGIERVRTINPKLAMASDEEVAAFLSGGKKSLADVDLAAIKAPVEELPIMALAGNISAEKILAKREAESSGLTEDQVRKDLAALRAGNTPTNIKKMVQQAAGGSVKSPAYVEFAKLADTANIPGATKETVAQYRSTALNALMSVHKAAQQAKWEGDMSAWAMPEGLTKTIADEIKSTGVAPTVQQVAKAMVVKVPTAQRAQAMEELKGIIYANAVPGQNSLLYAKDPNAAWKKAELEATRNRMGAILSGRHSADWDTVPNTGPSGAWDTLFTQQ